MKYEGNIIYADEGKTIKYKNSNVYFGQIVYIGTRRLPNGEIIEDNIDDFEEVDDINNEEINIGEV